MLDTLNGAASRVNIAPADAWLDVPPFVPKGQPAADRSLNGRYAWLSDTQITLQAAHQAWLSRTVYEITGSEGLQAAGSFEADFDPGFQTLTIHHLRIIRDGQTREVDVSRGLQLLRRERDMERAVFDGRITAHITIPDVRIGDIVDSCFSVSGANPILNNHFSAEMRMNWGCWVAETRVRLFSPGNRPLVVQTFNDTPEATVEQAGPDYVVRAWRTNDTPPVTFESFMPSWVRPFASVRVADQMSWTQVADTFRDYYADEPFSADLEALVAQVREMSAEPKAQAVNALRMIQNNLRYQSVSIGDGGFVPRSVNEIWSSRYGDCKDASRMLAGLLRRLGLDAAPALVNTFRTQALNEEAPSLLAFDHCIVKLTIGAQHYWLDPTLSPQGGALDRLRQARFGWALPLTPQATLESMGEDPLEDSYQVFETYHLPDFNLTPGKLEVRTVYFGWRADGMRRRLATNMTAVTRDLATAYEQRFDKVTALAPMQVIDDLELNRLELLESYELAPIWSSPSPDQVQFVLNDELHRPNLPALGRESRHWPITLGMPLKAQLTVELRGAVRLPENTWDRVKEGPGVRATSKLETVGKDGKTLRLERTLTLSRTTVRPDESRQLANLVEDLVNTGGFYIEVPARRGHVHATGAASKPMGVWRVVWLSLLGLYILSILFGFIR